MAKLSKAFLHDRNTTAVGIGLLLVAIGSAAVAIFDGDASTAPDWNVTIAEIVAAIGLFTAGDGGSGRRM